MGAHRTKSGVLTGMLLVGCLTRIAIISALGMGDEVAPWRERKRGRERERERKRKRKRKRKREKEKERERERQKVRDSKQE